MKPGRADHRFPWSVLAAALAVCGSRLCAQTKLEVTSALNAKFYSPSDSSGAVAAAQQKLAANLKAPGLLLKLAEAQVSVWQDREAVEMLTRAIAIPPQNADLYTERGHRELPLRKFAAALDDLNRATSLNPEKTDAWYHLGLAHYFLGEFAQAADDFRRAVEFAPNTDERINSTNWHYASLRRAGKNSEATKALAKITPEMKNTEPHTAFYLNLVRFFRGQMSESDALPPEPPPASNDTEAELRFDTVAYGIGNWHLYMTIPPKPGSISNASSKAAYGSLGVSLARKRNWRGWVARS
jgi:tetratricopeptide (TPR) repeat protein